MLTVKKSYNDPSKEITRPYVVIPGGQQEQGHGVVKHDQGEVLLVPLIHS